jgi:hypothetical protein
MVCADDTPFATLQASGNSLKFILPHFGCAGGIVNPYICDAERVFSGIYS